MRYAKPFLSLGTPAKLVSMLSFYFLLQLLLAVCVYGYSNPGTCSGACNVHDPALIKRSSDGTYFRFSTGGGISIATASAAAGPWTAAGTVLPSGSKISLTGNTGSDAWVSTATAYLLA